MTKVAIIANCTWNIKNFRLGLIKELISNDFETIVIAPKDETAYILTDEKIPFFEIQNLKRKGKNPFKDVLLIKEIRKILLDQKVDVVLNFTIKPVIYGTLAAKKSKTKVINTITGLGYSFLSTGLVNKVVYKLYKHSLKYSDVVVFQNPDDRALFLQIDLVKNDQVKIIPGSGINSAHFMSSSKSEPRELVHFLFVGRLLRDKGIVEYIAAAQELISTRSDAKFHVAGSVDFNNPSTISKNEFEEWSKNKSIIYHGESNDIKSIIEKIDVVVLPSYREGLPRVLLEAMSMEKAIITTNAPGCRETIKDNLNGFLVEPKNVESLAQTMHEIIDIGNEARLTMGKHGRQMVLENFDEKIIIGKYLDIINKLIDS